MAGSAPGHGAADIILSMTAPGKHRRSELIRRAAVYALCEPDSTAPTPDVVRYIGRTRHGISARFREHARRSSKPVAAWLASPHK